jgi:serine phosphatase RsbU (regulator of sigma subunit)
LFENTSPSAYATLFFADYDAATGRLRYANCGHVPGLILRRDGTLERLDSNNTVLGLFENWDCSFSFAQLAQGDLLALYTDGVTESSNSEGEEFGEERLAEALRRLRTVQAQDLGAGVLQHVLDFTGGNQFDDLTLIAARRDE